VSLEAAREPRAVPARPRTLDRPGKLGASRPGKTSARRVLWLALLPLALACGKKGDPLPPLRWNPNPVTDVRVAQRGTAIEVSFVVPSQSIDGLRLPVLDVDLHRADTEGDFPSVSRKRKLRAAPGETVVASEPLVVAGTTLRFAARARVKRSLSGWSSVATLTVQEPPPPPDDLAAELTPEGVALRWIAPPRLAAAALSAAGLLPQEPSEPAASPVEAEPVPGREPVVPSRVETAPEAAESLTPEPGLVEPTPEPTPEPFAGGVWVYRRHQEGVYEAALTAAPLVAESFLDGDAALETTFCYVARSVISRDPLIESGDSTEVCLEVRDIAPPAVPGGVMAFAAEGSLELSWSPVADDDLSHYSVYRQSESGDLLLVEEVPAERTVFSEALSGTGKRLSYRVAAVDRAGNESPLSSPAVVLLP
jgi:hypothetical protein